MKQPGQPVTTTARGTLASGPAHLSPSPHFADLPLYPHNAAGFALLAIIFTLVAFFTSVLRQRGWCSETFYAIMAFLASASHGHGACVQPP